MIVDFKELQEIKKQKESVVMNFLINYYKDLNDTGTVNIPYFLRAKNVYNDIIHNYKDLNRFYNKLISREYGN